MKEIIVCYCCFDSVKASTCFELSILCGSGAVHGVIQASGSYLPMCRNSAVASAFDQYPDFTHLLLVDADSKGVTPELVNRLSRANKDIVSAVYVGRKPPFPPVMKEEDVSLLLKEFEKPLPERSVIEVAGVGFGCCLISRAVFDRTREVSPEGNVLWFTFDRPPRESFWEEVDGDLEHLQKNGKDAYKAGLEKGLYAHIGSPFTGEDYAFCNAAKKVGFSVYLDTGCYIGHVGDTSYDVRDWLEFIRFSDKHSPEELESRIEQGVCAWRVNKTVDEQRIVHG